MFDWIGNLFGGGSKDSQQTTQNDIQQLPDYGESAGARQNWWDTLQQWSSQPGYGAIAPDWNSIWDNASKKVNQYFGGGPQGPGLNAQIKANLARRNMSENPASDALLQRSGFQQGNQLQDLAVNQATQQAQFGEQGRKTWLDSLMSLAGLKPSFSNFGTTTDTSYAPTSSLDNPMASIGGVGDIFSSLLGGGSGGGDLVSKISQLFGGGGNSNQANIGGVNQGGGSGGGSDWTQYLKYIPQIIAMFA